MMNCTFRPISTLILAITLIMLTITCRPKEPHQASEIISFSLADSLSIESACSRISLFLHSGDTCSPDAAITEFSRALDTASAFITRTVPVHEKQATCDSILSIVYKHWRITFDPADTIAATLLPELVFRNKKGACLGVSLIILMLAERTGCPIYGVMLPGHFFCRYDDGTVSRNIEPNLSGIAHDDCYYRERYPIVKQPWYDLANLSLQAAIGVLCYNAGSISLAKHRPDAAIALFKESLRRIPDFAEARGNLALANAQKGDIHAALQIFDTLFSAAPGLNRCAWNFGTIALAAGDSLKAISISKQGLLLFPNDSLLIRRIADLCGKTGEPCLPAHPERQE